MPRHEQHRATQIKIRLLNFKRLCFLPSHWPTNIFPVWTFKYRRVCECHNPLSQESESYQHLIGSILLPCQLQTKNTWCEFCWFPAFLSWTMLLGKTECLPVKELYNIPEALNKHHVSRMRVKLWTRGSDQENFELPHKKWYRSTLWKFSNNPGSMWLV